MKSNQILYGFVILFLVASNITTIILYRNHLEEHINQNAIRPSSGSPGTGQGFGLLKQLDLTEEQSVLFRSSQQEFNQSAGEIDRQMSEIRAEMLNQLASGTPDTTTLRILADDYGSLHSLLKEETFQFYLFMKENCNETQQQLLQDIFRKLLAGEQASGRGGKGSQWRGGHKKGEHRIYTD
jgi:Spy/CpxP family protein refolding chaperone